MSRKQHERAAEIVRALPQNDARRAVVEAFAKLFQADANYIQARFLHACEPAPFDPAVCVRDAFEELDRCGPHSLWAFPADGDDAPFFTIETACDCQPDEESFETLEEAQAAFRKIVGL